jgi:hypothetical protein
LTALWGAFGVAVPLMKTEPLEAFFLTPLGESPLSLTAGAAGLELSASELLARAEQLESD